MNSYGRLRGSVSTRLVTGIDPKTDGGRAKAFLNGAGECLIGAKKLDDGFSNLTGEYILTFHALELALKSFLAKSGLTNQQLKRKPYGHNLVNLYAEAQTRGLSISLPDAEHLIKWSNEFHDGDAFVRYEFTITRELPMCAVLFPLIEEVLSASK